MAIVWRKAIQPSGETGFGDGKCPADSFDPMKHMCDKSAQSWGEQMIPTVQNWKGRRKIAGDQSLDSKN
jgi:hypothetical protein